MNQRLVVQLCPPCAGLMKMELHVPSKAPSDQPAPERTAEWEWETATYRSWRSLESMQARLPRLKLTAITTASFTLFTSPDWDFGQAGHKDKAACLRYRVSCQ